ncbi:ABC transporter ATP-binding protein [Lactobacillus kefiranofaciens]|uniref:ABC transporter ATP-binding protein n=1 Tax=Lactobacillus kefiranofaciens TaxID=267818 RepID=A0AAX3UEK8_9LACO|nr:ABC transporter ATP-binding protein [Lactobacillus kefiranofaciens]AEG40756.1 ABC transporter ATP-binding and permease protein [Lactobacillus kefiranofaciens subsp. kefiranofaciens]WGO85944.1 ABC transporter ATP-binding protein [Lactobacillus kefiranofaciens]WQH36736.1 ABC transporter ATP-binding protein [Lactobacillus kefiranofaciens]
MGDTRKTIRYFIKYLKSYWKGITIVVILSLVSSGAQVLAPTFLGQAVTDLTNYLSDLKKETVSLNTFYGALGSMLVFYVLSQVAIFIAWMVMSKFNADSTNDMRENLFSKFQRMMIRYFDTHQDGKLLSLFTSDLDNIFNAMNNAIFEIISQGIMFIGTIIVMFTVNAQLAWTTIASTPLILIVAVLIMKKARIYLDKQQDEIGDLNGYITEQINGEKVIITNNLRQESVAGFKTYNNRVRKAMFKGQFYSGMLFPLMNGLNLLNLAIVIAMGAWMIISGQVSQAIGLGLIVTFVEYSQNYFQPLTQITSIYSMIQLALTGARRLATVEEQKDENAVPNGKILHGVQEGVKLENVHFGYDQNKEILHGVNIAVAKGQSVALVGPTGSGKTTIMNLLNRFYDVNSGKVTFDNIDVRDIQLKSLRDNVGIVLQDSALFSGTIADNIRYGKPNATMDEVISAAKQANIHDFIESLPDGYNTRVNDASSVFSTGQKQLVSIARTILTNPDFLILDEATSNVDTVTEEKIQQAMDAVIAGRTSFVIAHRLKTILNSNKIVVLKDGNVIEEGSHEKLLADKGFYYKLYTDQTAFN